MFDKYHVSKSGKMIPLNKQTGEPHQCPENPYSKQQQQSQQPQQQEQQKYTPTKDYGISSPIISEESVQKGITAFTMMNDLIGLVEQTQKLLVSIDGKLDRLLNLAERK